MAFDEFFEESQELIANENAISVRKK